MKSFVLTFETSAGINRQIEIQAHSVDGALAKWDLIRQPGDFLDAIGEPFRMEWPND